MGEKLKLRNLVATDWCGEHELRENINRIEYAFGILDQLLDLEFDDGKVTLTINLQNINEITANQINSGSYNDSGEIEYCFDYCPTAISETIIKSGGGPDAEIFRNYELDEDWITWDDLHEYQQQMLIQQQQNSKPDTGILGI